MAALSRSILSSLATLVLVGSPSLALAQDPAPSEATPAAAAAEAPAPAEAAPAVSAAAAEAPPPAAPEAPPAAPEAPKPKPPPYALPFQLRPVGAGTVIRSDTAFAFYDSAGKSPSGNTIASTLLASYKVTPEFSPLIRVGLVSDSPPTGESAVAFMNPVLGGIYGIKPSPETRLGLFLGATIPIGSGGGNSPDLAARAAMLKGIAARSGMDNAMFAANYFTIFPGVGFAYVAHGLTVQVEATLLELIRTRGDNVDKESTRTNLTMGAHVGYFILPELSLGVELRHQRWLSTPAAVEANPAARDTTTFAVGPRLHFKLSDTAWFRPGIVYARALDKPLSTNDYNIVQLDLPFSF
jgi:hypothetical protein